MVSDYGEDVLSDEDYDYSKAFLNGYQVQPEVSTEGKSFFILQGTALWHLETSGSILDLVP